jgi:hypothetical protein
MELTVLPWSQPPLEQSTHAGVGKTRVGRGFRNAANYGLRVILAAGRLTHPNLQ